MTPSPYSDSVSLRLLTFSVLHLAIYNNSPDRSTKSTTSHFNVLCLLVNIGFQVLFHSPPGVLFTFPSRYYSSIGHQVVFSLMGWSPLLSYEIPRVSFYSGYYLASSSFIYGTLTLFGLLSQTIPLDS